MKNLIIALSIILITLLSCEKESETVKFEYDYLIKRYITQHEDTDSIFYYYNSSDELIKKVEYRFDKHYDSIVAFVDKKADYYKMIEDYYYFNDANQVVRKSSFGNTEEYEYNDFGQLVSSTSGVSDYSVFIYKNNILQRDTTIYSIDQGFVTQITNYQFYDTLNHDLNFPDIGLLNYGLRTKNLIQTETVISQDNLGFLNDTMIIKMEYTFSDNTFQVDYKTFEKGKEIEQFRMQKLTKRIR